MVEKGLNVRLSRRTLNYQMGRISRINPDTWCVLADGACHKRDDGVSAVGPYADRRDSNDHGFRGTAVETSPRISACRPVRRVAVTSREIV